MPKKLDQVAALSWDDKELTGMRASLQLFLDLQSQPVHASPHVRLSDRQLGRQLYPVVRKNSARHPHHQPPRAHRGRGTSRSALIAARAGVTDASVA